MTVQFRKSVTVAVFVSGFVVATAAGLVAARLERRAAEQEVSAAVDNRISAWKREVQAEESRLRVLEAHLRSTAPVKRPEVEEFIADLRLATKSKSRYYWMTMDGNGVPPWLAGRDEFRTAVSLAQMKGGLTLSPRLEIPERQYPIAVILPVEREGKLLGMAIGVTTGIELLERSFSRLRPFGINASIYDLDADPASSLLAFHKSRRSRKARTPEWNMPRPAQRGEHSLQVEWGKRKWLIECAPIAELRLDRPSWGIVGLTGAGWMITVLTANLLRRGEAQRARVEMLVQERTRELQEARDIALEASKMKSQLVANVSHELRTPLNGILGAQSLLAESTLNEEQREYSETIRTCGRGLLSLVEDLLDASRMESGSAALRDEEYNVRGLLAECSAIARLEAATRDLEWKLELGDDLPEWTRGDARRVRQILLNLVTNAIKFTENGEVALAAEREGEWLRFQVRDTGCGIPDSEKGRLFGRFVQVDASKKRRQSGVGLGLSITKGFVEQMGGQIGFESKAGQGSTFWVRIPYREAAGRVSVAKNLEWTWGAAGELNGAEVLVAEDNRVNQTLAKQMLERMGCKVSIAADGREACNMAAAKRFDVILMDLQMPVMDGLEAAEEIRSAWRWEEPLAIIAFSANVNAEDIAAARLVGMERHVAKPVEPGELARTIRECLAERIAAQRPTG